MYTKWKDVVIWKSLTHHLSFVKVIHWLPRDSPHKGPVVWSFGDSFVVGLSKLLNELPVTWDTKTRRPCDVIVISENVATTLWRNSDSITSYYNDVIMRAMASQITSLTTVYSASLAFVRGIRRWPVNSPHKGPVTRKMFPFDDIIMIHVFARYILTCKFCRCQTFLLDSKSTKPKQTLLDVCIPPVFTENWFGTDPPISCWDTASLYMMVNMALYRCCFILQICIHKNKRTHFLSFRDHFKQSLMPPFHWATICCRPCRPLPIWRPKLERQQSAIIGKNGPFLHTDYAVVTLDTLQIRIRYD